MAKGSIRFDDLINVEVAVDPTQAAGAKLLSAVNLVDGQSLGGGGGGDFDLFTVNMTSQSDGVVILAPLIYEDEGNKELAFLTELYDGDEYVAELVGLNGEGTLYTNIAVTTSGDISLDSTVMIENAVWQVYVVTGECTIFA